MILVRNEVLVFLTSIFL